MPKLSSDRIQDEMKALPGWEYKDNAIGKLYRFKEFMDGIRFVERVAAMAQAADHHPDILINYTRVTFKCTTHSAGAVTEKDIRLAKQIEEAFGGPEG
jgi:4a-hydroxytetrahydrobiopterin dehydratase